MEKTHQQLVFDELNELDTKIKELSERKQTLLSNFYENNKDLEFPVVAEDGKMKYFRVYEPEGRFVYNIKHEAGLRVKPVLTVSEKASL